MVTSLLIGTVGMVKDDKVKAHVKIVKCLPCWL